MRLNGIVLRVEVNKFLLHPQHIHKKTNNDSCLEDQSKSGAETMKINPKGLETREKKWLDGIVFSC